MKRLEVDYIHTKGSSIEEMRMIEKDGTNISQSTLLVIQVRKSRKEIDESLYKLSKPWSAKQFS
jgi:hypothetical protein